MASQGSRQTLVRQWEMLKLLPTRQPGITARQITQQLNDKDFDVSKRQVERDLDLLSQSFAIVCNDKGKPYGWHWMEGVSIDIPAVSAAEALSLTMVEKVLKPLVPTTVLQSIAPRLNQAKDKLTKLQQQSDLASWQEKVAYVPATLQQQAPAIDDDVLSSVQIALLRGRCVEVSYKPIAQQSKSKRYILHPLSIVQRGVSSYLVARVEPYQDVLLFAMHRMKEATVLDDKAAVAPEGFTLSNYLEQGALQFSDGEVFDLKAVINDDLAMHLEEAPLGDDQTITKLNQKNQLTVTVADSWQLRWWILSQGEQIEVREPCGLREEIKATLKSALKHYQ